MLEERQHSMEKRMTILGLERAVGEGEVHRKTEFRNEGEMKKAVGRQGRLSACWLLPLEMCGSMT